MLVHRREDICRHCTQPLDREIKGRDRIGWVWLYAGTGAIARTKIQTSAYVGLVPRPEQELKRHEIQRDKNFAMGCDRGSHCFSNLAGQQN